MVRVTDSKFIELRATTQFASTADLVCTVPRSIYCYIAFMPERI